MDGIFYAQSLRLEQRRAASGIAVERAAVRIESARSRILPGFLVGGPCLVLGSSEGCSILLGVGMEG